jgi:uncharacterized protein (DUF2147 family)
VNRVLIGIVLCIAFSSAFAQSPKHRVLQGSVTGYWTTVDDVTGKVRSVLQLWERNGVIYGRVSKIFKQPGDTGICSKCPGRFRNKPILGLMILWGLERTGDREWSGGQILDPKTGNIYRLVLFLSRDGRSLTARGYLGFRAFGRNQQWFRRF